MSEYNVKAIRSDGLVFNYDNSNIRVISVEGADFPDMEVSKEARGFGHGDIITGIRKKGREITLVAMLTGLTTYRQDRAQIIGFHNANYKYDLEITYLGVKRIVKDCVLSQSQYPTERKNVNPKLTLLFESSEADLFADNIDKTSFVTSNPLWHDTRHYTNGSSLAFGEILKTTEKVINYLGSEPTPISIIVNATGHVPIINIELGSNKITINETLQNGDTLIIDGVTRTATKNGKPIALNQVTMQTLYKMWLQYGDNIVKVDAGDNVAFNAEVSYVGRYGGV